LVKINLIILIIIMNVVNQTNKVLGIYNNPGNLEKGQKYAGETGKFYGKDDRFVVFDTPEMGVRALARDIKTKIKNHNGDITAMISQYAPKDDDNETESYINFVKERVGKDKVTEADLPIILRSIINFENKPDVAKRYLQPNVFSTGIMLSNRSFSQDTSFEKAKEMMGIK
tara:strand:- start:43 stop:555 length:513 start_codon:yes stop_codon:yes gene_type:complete